MKHFPRGLRHLKLNQCFRLTSKGLTDLPQKLRYLDLGNKIFMEGKLTSYEGGCSGITDSGIRYMSRGLESLHLWNCLSLSNNGKKVIYQMFHYNDI